MITELRVIDLALGAQVINDNEVAAKKMLKLLLADLQIRFPQLQAAYESRDIEKLRNIAHYLHGGACYCGAPRFKQAAAIFERKLQGDNISFDELAVCYQQFCEEIRALITAGADL